MIDSLQLIEKLDKRLAEYQYSSDREASIPDVLFVSYVKKHNVFKTRNLFAVVEIPDNVVEIEPLKRLFGSVKKSLLNKYGEAFLWKELEVCLVVLCNHEVYNLIKKDEGKVAEAASFSLNAMLGTCFIDKQTLDHYPQSTWGLHFSGNHFEAVNETVALWCEGQKDREGDRPPKGTEN